MRKLYNEFFYIPKDGKIREKVMLVRVAMTVIIMVACLAAMSLTAYAYFSYNVSSGSNIIKTAIFEAEVSISKIEGNDRTPVDIKTENGTQKAELEANATYEVTLTPGANSTAETGFCIITAKDCMDTYHTQQLGVDKSAEGGMTSSITFTLKVSNDTTVEIVSHWGTSSSYADYAQEGEGCKLYITNKNVGDQAVTMKIKDVVNSISEPDEEEETTSDKTKEPETKEPETTEPETTEPETTPAEVIYTVAANDNLTRIANQYNTTVDRIAAYNHLSDKNNILVGQQLKIPPEDWVMPADTTQTTTPGVTAPETTGTNEPTGTTGPGAPATETTTTQPTDTTETETTTTQPTETTDAEITGTDPTEQTRPAECNTEPTDVPTTDAGEP